MESIMEVYKFINLNNGDILLEKVIIDNIDYCIINKNNGDKILKKIVNINITDASDIKKYDFTKSNIVSLHIFYTINSIKSDVKMTTI